MNSRLPGFHKLTTAERLERILQEIDLDSEQLEALSHPGGLPLGTADHMIENVIATFGLPLGIATNFRVNGRDVLVPMAIEEPSVVAGASFMAKLAREGGGFQAEAGPSEMIGQIQILEVQDIEAALRRIDQHRGELLAEADKADPMLASLGGGARDLKVRTLEDTPVGPMLVVHLIIDTLDAMGANAVNSAVERLGSRIESLTGGRVHLRILSNLADRRLARARCSIPAQALAFGSFTGEQVRDGIIEAWAFAAADPYRAATHNKGILNGIDAVVIATGNDWRAVEAGAHAYAARSGRYTSLSEWRRGEGGSLEGMLEMPLAIGTVGGATRVHPLASVCLKIMQTKSAGELAEVTIAVGLAQNLAALRALATEGIQRGHMRLHARQIAIAAGAQGELIDRVASQLVAEGEIQLRRAEELVRKMQG